MVITRFSFKEALILTYNSRDPPPSPDTLVNANRIPIYYVGKGCGLLFDTAHAKCRSNTVVNEHVPNLIGYFMTIFINLTLRDTVVSLRQKRESIHIVNGLYYP